MRIPDKKIQKYLNKKSPITGYGLHSKFNLKDVAKCGKVGGSWGKVYKMFGIGEMTQSNAKGNFQKNFLRRKKQRRK